MDNLSIPILRSRLALLNDDDGTTEILHIAACYLNITDSNTAVVSENIGTGISTKIKIVNVDRTILTWAELTIIMEHYPRAEALIVQCEVLVGSSSSFLAFLSNVSLSFMAILVKGSYLTTNVNSIVFLRNWETAISDSCLHVFYQSSYSDAVTYALQQEKYNGQLVVTGYSKENAILQEIDELVEDSALDLDPDPDPDWFVKVLSPPPDFIASENSQ
jgi:hypothetical protein